MSKFQAPGPSIVPLPAFPKEPVGGLTNAVVSNHFVIVGLLNLGLPTAFGRSAPPVSEVSVPTVTVEAVPDAAVKIVDSCQPPSSRCFQRDDHCGDRTTSVELKARRRSARQFPYSA